MPQLTLRKIQKPIVDHILRTKRCAIWAGMGTGKTSAVLYALNILAMLEHFKTLVIAPSRVARVVWPDEINQWFSGCFTVSVIEGAPKQRLAALEAKADIYTLNYENIPWLVSLVGEEWPFKVVVCDEATKLRGFRTRQGTLRAKYLAKVVHTQVHRFIELTGTPSPNGLKDLWGQIFFIDRGVRLGPTYDWFIKRWFSKADRFSSPAPIKGAQQEITAAISDVCLSLKAEDYFSVDKPILNDIYVEMSDYAKRQYKKLKRELFLAFEDGVEVSALNKVALINKCLQLANGAVYTNGTYYKEVHSAKIEALESIIEESGGAPILVSYQFNFDADLIQRRFNEAVKITKNGAIEAWNRGDIPLLLAHPASAGHGLNLQHGGNILAYFGCGWNLETYEQISGRISPLRQKQAGLNRPVFIHRIIAKGTIDELVIKAIANKTSVQDEILEAVKKKAYA